MNRNLAEQTNDRILEVNHRCGNEALLLMLENDGSPPLSVNVVVEWYDIDSDWNKNFWKHKIYINPEKLLLGENFILLWKDFYSVYYNGIKGLLEEFNIAIEREDIKELILSGIYYPDYWFIGNSVWTYNNSINFKKEIYINLFKSIFWELYTENEIDYLVSVIDTLMDSNDILDDFEEPIAKIIYTFLSYMEKWYDIDEVLQIIFYDLDEYFIHVKRILHDFIYNEIEWLEEILNKEEYEENYDNIEDVKEQYSLLLSIYNKIYTSPKYDKEVFLETLNNLLLIDQNYTEGKILMEKVPLTYWEKVEINSDYFRGLEETKRNKILSLLEEKQISYSFI